MKNEALGYDPSGKGHCRTLTPEESAFVDILWLEHVGSENAMPAAQLAVRFKCLLEGWECPQDITGRVLEMERTAAGRRALDRWKRDVRQMATHLLNDHDGIVILSRAGLGGGYWIADSDEEIDGFYGTFRKRGLHGLKKASRGNRQRFSKIITQAVFDFDGVDGSGEMGGDSATFETVDALLEKMTADPARYAGVLRALGAKHGRILLDKTVVDEFRAKAMEMARIAERL